MERRFPPKARLLMGIPSERVDYMADPDSQPIHPTPIARLNGSRIQLDQRPASPRLLQTS